MRYGDTQSADVGQDTESEEARMGLSEYKVAAGVAASDMDRELYNDPRD